MNNILCGNEMDKMPAWAFRIMSVMFRVEDLFVNREEKLEQFGIHNGDTVVDYGCGTGRYLRKASELTGDSGKVYAVDIHELAVKAAENQARKHGLKNIIPLATDGKNSEVPAHCADLIYALDMFHMVGNTTAFLSDLHRIVKSSGVLVIEDGHQPRSLAKEKIIRSKLWEIFEEQKGFMRCKPRN
jgi:ubiquinone/menaquinone biosynthesis C-methylase UbiE